MKISLLEKQETKCPYLSNSFLKIFDDYTAEHLKGERTCAEYRYVIFSLCNSARRDFLDLEQNHITEFLSAAAGGDGQVSSNSFKLRVIHAIARYIDENADRYAIIPRYLPLLSSINPKIPEAEYDPKLLPSLEDIDTVLAYAKKEQDMVLFLACALVLRCSLTLNELIKLTKTNFFQDLDGNYGLRMKLSSLADRFVKIPEDIAELIIQYSRSRQDDLPALFITKKGTAMTKRTLQNRLRVACLDCGIDPFCFNDLRILSIAYILKGGASLDQVASYTNMKKKDWLFRYNRVVSEIGDAACDYSHIRIII